jgi:para-nitrobenzyl esterase
LPVLVWIYGGGFTGGMTSLPMYNGENLAGKGVVVVSIAYRVGPFGFLAHPELSKESDRGSGNFGLEDMIFGLEWVKNNIGQFGGDPSKVTIFGHSAGGMAVSMLAASPVATGLFRGVIAMSGASMAPLRTSRGETGTRVPLLSVAETEGAVFLGRLGAADIAAARDINAEDIQKAIAGSGVSFRPVNDGHIIIDDQYLLYQADRFNDTPILLGSTSDEMATFGGARGITVAEFVRQVNENYRSEAADILAAYPHASDEEATLSSRLLSGDTTFGWNVWAWARMQARHGNNKAFLYYFDHYDPTTSPGGAGHGLDVPYAFRTLTGINGAPPEAVNAALSDLISSYWVNFTKTGDPNAAGLPEWPAYSDASPQGMIFHEGAGSAADYPNIERMQALDNFFARLRSAASR